MKCLNLGCGTRFVEGPEWINLDFKSYSSAVVECDLTKGIPFEDESFDFVYHSHILEHFSKEAGEKLIEECYRVLKNKGLIRVVVPDLEGLAKSYLTSLNTALNSPSNIHDANYSWSAIELFDQMVRSTSGGEMKKYWEQDNILNEEFIKTRVGEDFLEFRKYYFANKKTIDETIESKPVKKSFKGQIKSKIKRTFGVPEVYSDQNGFRESGEIHKWMYDRYSLVRLLQKYKFIDAKVMSASESRNAKWQQFAFLDVENNLPRKPDSLFVEAYK